MNSLEHHLLIAMPSLQDPFFARTVTYLCEHNDEGAMGLIINQPVDITLDALLRKMSVKGKDFELPQGLENLVLMGGPVNPERGFVLHTAIEGLDQSHPLPDDLMITTSRDVLGTFGGERQPNQSLVALGYAGWSAGQLEQELADNAWLTIPAELDLMFDIPLDQRWQEATRRLGIDVWQLSSDVGHS
ncbi:YqgE/AlgH family protein [Ferrimonas marina]|uniref:UPF0301 protein SAMN02745129_4090 n=1 Tax=Ferrimonas marina TaxID=299255 RepID=A0A1M5YD73_9GAMM|nr:YqgE/AlgH family protein [Ferrimonas marina]SHI09834.1 putative transcriptional regulator [Ferrimonas marina]